ncbi:GNAT family N-acetyltransferase [Oceanomicrobium pacificus]|uniref:GNAT family N-acetyltransferase n=1 Tax=Oceanomicrobium pacificus TaxID=2692916 RepID=A0A6B0TLW9_9RHOB|nr:GNAT family N-acetyltransferase [Oceanomicrobium pacificus]MXU64896.1 GNAT family N-acetyltransferase [Oceanomicrobium pacificus]
MTELKAGARIDYTVTYLEMTDRPSVARPHAPLNQNLLLIAAENPPPWYFLSLYDAVGGELEWTDWHQRPAEELAAFVSDPDVTLFTLMRTGWPAGFFMLDTREAGVCDLAYFGLVPEAVGLRLGSYLLQTAVHTGWDQPGVQRMTVNTCTLDHPRALPLYQKMGFSPVRQERQSRILTRDRITPVAPHETLDQ